MRQVSSEIPRLFVLLEPPQEGVGLADLLYPSYDLNAGRVEVTA